VSSDLSERFFKKRLNIILIYPFDHSENSSDGTSILRVRSIKDTRRAIEEYEQLEEEMAGKADVVLVRAEDIDTLMKVFQNYFTDARDFVSYVRAGLRELAP
jgi:hypothetical protein